MESFRGVAGLGILKQDLSREQVEGYHLRAFPLAFQPFCPRHGPSNQHEKQIPRTIPVSLKLKTLPPLTCALRRQSGEYPIHLPTPGTLTFYQIAIFRLQVDTDEGAGTWDKEGAVQDTVGTTVANPLAGRRVAVLEVAAAVMKGPGTVEGEVEDGAAGG